MKKTLLVEITVSQNTGQMFDSVVKLVCLLQGPHHFFSDERIASLLQVNIFRENKEAKY